MHRPWENSILQLSYGWEEYTRPWPMNERHLGLVNGPLALDVLSRREQLRHRAVSLRQHGFLVLFPVVFADRSAMLQD